MVIAGKALLLLLGAAGLGLALAHDEKPGEKPVTGTNPNGSAVPPGVLCEAPNGVIVICHDFQPTALAVLANTYTTIGSGNQYPTVGISPVPTQGSQPIPQWMAQQLQAGKLILISCDGVRRELIACERGEEIALCPKNPLRNAVLVEPTPGAGQQPNPNGPGVPAPGGQPQPQQPAPGGLPGFPGGMVPPIPGGLIPDFTSPTPPPWWMPGVPWPGAQGQTPGQPTPGQPQPQPAPGVPPPNNKQAPPGWPSFIPYPPLGMPFPDFSSPTPPAWWIPGVPWPGAPGGGTTTTPGAIDRSFRPPLGSTLAKGPDGYWRHVIRPGDIGTTLAQWYAGSVSHTTELEKTNPELVRVNDANGKPLGWSPWMVGQVLVLPLNWDGTKGPAPGLGGMSIRSAKAPNGGGFFTAPSTRARPTSLQSSLGSRIAQKTAALRRGPVR